MTILIKPKLSFGGKPAGFRFELLNRSFNLLDKSEFRSLILSFSFLFYISIFVLTKVQAS